MGSPASDRELHRLGGCPQCLHTGYRGFAPVFEVLVVGKSLRPLLRPETADEELLKAALADGMVSFRAGLSRLVWEGSTSLAEALRLGLCQA